MCRPGSSARKTPAPSVSLWLSGHGIAVTLASNVAHDPGRGAIGAAALVWPTIVLVGAREMLDGGNPQF